ncbi:hypothetical protein E2P64_08140 [Candidatus Bathyarchaeota archaeon]|nr:hypothetical protein E2P64_08140 [Candidatus Bathyarchaeota archaeon]
MSIQKANEVLSEIVDRLNEGADEELGDELKVFIDNDGQLYRSQAIPIYKNLVNKHAAGKYQSDLAVKLFMYLVDAGAKKYAKEEGSKNQKWNDIFSKATRLYVAKELEKEFKAEMKLGNYDNLLMKKYQK